MKIKNLTNEELREINGGQVFDKLADDLKNVGKVSGGGSPARAIVGGWFLDLVFSICTK
ncbi:MAG: hypothetical protein IJL20_08050 [Lachnospiraceae bacterium]|nr:hypothetical protein [Lachnospiraceae bacterium]